MNIRKSSQKPISNICFYFFSLADVLRTTDLSSLSSLEDFLKLFIADPKSEPTFLSFLVPKRTTTIISISNIDHGEIPLSILSPHLFRNFFSSNPDNPNLAFNSARISFEEIPLKDKETKL